jgi:hypothetical protein
MGIMQDICPGAWFLSAGSLLGKVRKDAVIPHDDDGDLTCVLAPAEIKEFWRESFVKLQRHCWKHGIECLRLTKQNIKLVVATEGSDEVAQATWHRKWVAGFSQFESGTKMK